MDSPHELHGGNPLGESMTKLKLLPPQHEEDNVNYTYVFTEDIRQFHGDDFFEKWNKAFGIGTAPMIGDGSRSAVFYEDYVRFARLVVEGTPTYWD
jgi:hypothetical protein